MGVLTVIDSDGDLKEYNLEQFYEPRITFGRNEKECDIVVGCPFVSAQHGKFKYQNGELYYADIGSTNGSVVCTNGHARYERKSSYYTKLKDGDFISVKESVQETENCVLILYNQIKDDISWNRISIGRQSITIGRDEANDIVLSHVGVSRYHAVIQEKNGKYVLKDLKSSNGVFVNGSLVQGECILQNNAIITVLDTKIIFYQEYLFYKSYQNGVSLSVSHLSKKVNHGKYILQDVNLSIGSNEFVAIIGGSGAGKSTLMNAISGFDKDITGEIFCNGMDLRRNFSYLKEMIGFVPQEDIIYDNLTLEKMLYYTARLKMPQDTTKAEIDRQIHKVLDMVELKAHRSTFIRKLSGGQKKRASIAVELLANPRLFFLDEPTSGLDPGTEKNLMQTLNRLAKLQGKTVVMVTHTTQNLHLCDKVIFMGPGGKLVFYGTVEQAKMFFDTDSLVDIYNMIAEDCDIWANQFANCMKDETVLVVYNKPEKVKAKRAGFLRQLGVLTMRYAELIRNDLQRFMMLFLQPVLIALLLYIVAADEVFDIYEDTKSILFALSCAVIWIGLFNSIQEVCKERSILRREYMGNLRLSAYVLSKFIVQAVIGALQTALILCIFTKGVGQAEKGLWFKNPFFENYVLIWLTILAATALGFLISSFVRSVDKAMVLAPFVLIIQLLFSGILFDLEGIGEKIAKLTISKWSVEGLGTIAHLNKMTLRLQKEIPSLEHEASAAFKYTVDHLNQSYIVLGSMCLVCILACMILLRSLQKDKR